MVPTVETDGGWGVDAEGPTSVAKPEYTSARAFKPLAREAKRGAKQSKSDPGGTAANL